MQCKDTPAKLASTSEDMLHHSTANTSHIECMEEGVPVPCLEETPFSELFVEFPWDDTIPGGQVAYTEGLEYSPCNEFELLFQYDPEAAITMGKGDLNDVTTLHTDKQLVETDYDIMLSNLIVESGRYNFCGDRVPVHSKWNTDLLSQLLTDYHDRAVTEFLKYGWPVDRDPNIPLSHEVPTNHKSATDFPDAIQEYIRVGIENNYIAGPYDFPAFGEDSVNSPLSSRPKRASDQCRILMDLSWPQDGSSVNDGLSRHFYLQEPITLRYPTVQSFVKRIKQLGPGCLMYKRDLHKSFCQLPLCPSAYRLIGFSWEGRFYFKKVMPMGLTCACLAMQRTAPALRYIHNQMGYYLCPYIDDFAGCEAPEQAWAAYEALGRMMRDVGAKKSMEKAIPPTPIMEFLGNNLNTLDMTISVTPDRLEELSRELDAWEEKALTTRKQLESIIGKLQFCCNCV